MKSNSKYLSGNGGKKNSIYKIHKIRRFLDIDCKSERFVEKKSNGFYRQNILRALVPTCKKRHLAQNDVNKISGYSMFTMIRRVLCIINYFKPNFVRKNTNTDLYRMIFMI